MKIRQNVYWLWHTDLAPGAVFVALTLSIIYPFLSSGYILTLDMVFTPKLRMPTSIANDYFLQAFLHALNSILASDILEKLLLGGIIWLSGFGLYRLARQLDGPRQAIYQTIGYFVGGILYAVNSFTYDRFMAGQYEVLLGYSLLPWYAAALMRLLYNPSWRSTFVWALYMTLIGMLSIHTLGFALLLAGIGISLSVWKRRGCGQSVYPLLRYCLTGLLGVLAISLYWVIPLLRGDSGVAAVIHGFGVADRSAFSTLGGSVFGRFENVARLQGFWAEAWNLYLLPQDVQPVWSVLTIILWLLVLLGVVRFWHDKQRIFLAFLILTTGVVACLAMGLGGNWLSGHVPFYAGYREPEKFVMVIALVFSICSARGTAALLMYTRAHGGVVVTVAATALLLAFPFIWTPTMTDGFHQQLVPVQYPASWSVVNSKLDRDRGKFRVLFLPWHLYMYFNFAGRIIANPAPRFFDTPVVSSNNPEFQGVRATTSTLDASVSRILLERQRSNMGAMLAPLGIKYVILARDDDYQAYDYLDKQADLKLVYRADTMELYSNKAYGRR